MLDMPPGPLTDPRRIGRGSRTWGLRQVAVDGFCRTPKPFGLGYAPADIDAIIAERRARDAQELALQSDGCPTREENPGGRGKTSDNISSFGTDAEYLTARIARDRPDILDRMKAGEFRSVRAAAYPPVHLAPARGG